MHDAVSDWRDGLGSDPQPHNISAAAVGRSLSLSLHPLPSAGLVALAGARTQKLVDLAEKFFVKEPELWASSRLLYSSILADTVADHRPNNEDLGRLVMLKWTLGLSSQEVASCHQRVGGWVGSWRPLFIYFFLAPECDFSLFDFRFSGHLAFLSRDVRSPC